MQNSRDVDIFWDFGNCPAPLESSGYVVVDKIRLLALRLGPIKSFKAYIPVSGHNSLASNGRALALRSELQSSGVSLIDAPGIKGVADRMLIVDMITHAFDQGPESCNVIMLISGDAQFAYSLSILRMRNYRVVLLGTGFEDANASMAFQSSLCLDWNSEIVAGVPSVHLQKEKKSDGSSMDTPAAASSTCESAPGINQASRSTFKIDNNLHRDFTKNHTTSSSSSQPSVNDLVPKTHSSTFKESGVQTEALPELKSTTNRATAPSDSTFFPRDTSQTYLHGAQTSTLREAEDTEEILRRSPRPGILPLISRSV